MSVGNTTQGIDFDRKDLTLVLGENLDLGGDLHLSVLISPNYLSPAALPDHHKQRLSNIIRKHIDTLEEIKLITQWQNVLYTL